MLNFFDPRKTSLVGKITGFTGTLGGGAGIFGLVSEHFIPAVNKYLEKKHDPSEKGVTPSDQIAIIGGLIVAASVTGYTIFKIAQCCCKAKVNVDEPLHPKNNETEKLIGGPNHI